MLKSFSSKTDKVCSWSVCCWSPWQPLLVQRFEKTHSCLTKCLEEKGHGLKSFYNTICGFLAFVSQFPTDTVLFSSWYLPAVFAYSPKITDTYKHGTLNLSRLLFLFTSIIEFHKMESCGDEHFVLEWKLVEL